VKNVWLLGFGLFGIGGAVQGALGYLPLYLRGVGWLPAYADGALSVFHTASMIFVVPVAMWSDRLQLRKPFLLTAGLMIATGIGLLSFVEGALVWAAVMLSGAVRDAFMAMFQTVVVESDRVGATYAGTAIGFALALGGLSNVIAPPVGNSLATVWQGAPFAFWAALAVFGLGCLWFVKEGRQSADNVDVEVVSAPVEIAR
jgi:hypothetical protein